MKCPNCPTKDVSEVVGSSICSKTNCKNFYIDHSEGMMSCRLEDADDDSGINYSSYGGYERYGD